MDEEDGGRITRIPTPNADLNDHEVVEHESILVSGGEKKRVPKRKRSQQHVKWTSSFEWKKWRQDGEYGIVADDSEEEEDCESSQPWFVWPTLVLAVLAVSSAGAVTKLMAGAAPISAAAWRLQLTSVVQLPGFAWQWTRLSAPARESFLRKKNIGIIVVSAIALGFHFGLWVWSLSNTSLAHSLLLVATPPAIIAVFSFVRGQNLSSEEYVGLSLGVLGIIIIASGTRVEHDHEVTLIGDMAAFLSAAAFAVHIIAGSNLRAWMPLFVYLLPVTAGAALLLTISGISLEGWHESSTGEISGPFGWLRKEYWLLNLVLAVGPGFIGHSGLNAVLGYASSLVVAMSITLEPLLGAAIAWALGVSPIPGFWTCVGGFVMLLGTLLVTSGQENVQVLEDADKSVLVDHSSTLEDGNAIQEGQELGKPLLQQMAPS